MRRWISPWLLLLVAGCGQAPAPETSAPQTSAPPASPPPVATDAAKPKATAVLRENELAPLFTRLSAMTGHEAWSQETIAASVKQMKGIAKGSFLSGDMHMDHKGSHVDVTMRVDHEPDGRFRLTFTAPNDDLIKAIAEILPKAPSAP
ncbi:MAG: hypothetical protein ACO1SV_03525 [Fimbriimonas sp.]